MHFTIIVLKEATELSEVQYVKSLDEHNQYLNFFDHCLLKGQYFV